MKRLTSYIYVILAAMLVSACTLSKTEWVPFEDFYNPDNFSSLDSSKCFIPYGAMSGDLDQEAIKGCKVPLGRTVEEVLDEEDAQTDTKTTSVNMVGLFKGILSSWHSARVESYAGSYWSVDVDGKPLLLSGKIVLPADHNVSRVMIAPHFTIGADRECPSNDLPIEAVFAARGIAVIAPDYIGYGITRNMIHPYLVNEITSRNVMDMYDAAMAFLESDVMNCKPVNDDIFVFGYSQGGAVAYGVGQYIEERRPDIDIRLLMCGSGPYDICQTYDKLIENNFSDYPCAIPMIIQGLDYGMHLGLDYDNFFLPGMSEKMFGDGTCYPGSPAWVNSKDNTMAEISSLIGSKQISSILTELAMNKVNPEMTELYRAMVDNSVVNRDMVTSCPIYIFHSIDDNVVPYENYMSIAERLSAAGCNFTSNIGHYGGHEKGFMRFLYSSLKLMKDNNDIDKVF